MLRQAAAAGAALGLLVSVPVQAEECLDSETMMAARLHEFSAIMLTVTLRCRAIGVDIVPRYEEMLRVHAPAINASVRRLRNYFSKSTHAFDNYTTALGNRYGGGATDPANCRRFEKVSADLALAPDLPSLARVVFAMVPKPHVEGISCQRQ